MTTSQYIKINNIKNLWVQLRTDELNYAIGKTSTHESRNLRIMHLHG